MSGAPAPERLAPGQLTMTRLVRKHIGREENAVCVRDALAWLEGLPEGCCPQSVQWKLLDLACRWGRWMNETDRRDFLGPLLPEITGTQGWDGLPGAVQRGFQERCLGWWLPDWLRLASLRRQAGELERLDPAGVEAAGLALALGEELGGEMDSLEYQRVTGVLLASGQGQVVLATFRLDAAIRAASQECIRRALRRRQGMAVQDTVRRHARDAAQTILTAVRERTPGPTG